MVLSRYRLVVLVHGCFWHGHICRIGHLPKSNTAYWSAKIERNIARDARNRSALEALGWHVATVRECTLEQDTEQLLMELNHIRAATRKRVDTGTPLN
jgi:DNA mismatch endonuclease (patch repair protein)